LELEPGFTISGWKPLAAKTYSPETMAMLVDGLRLAGLPE
jgi:hypothetical protein